MIRATAIDHIVLNVRDPEASAAWYTSILGMSREEHIPGPGKTPRISLHFGAQKINLRPIAATQAEWFTGHHPATGSDDLCFLVDASPDAVLAHLAQQGVVVEVGPVEKRGARGTICSVYCRDPDGNLVELSSYPSA
ncbi:VOC family protein [Novosphingobium terrae]|uniref:VOC family protein n=1 Tax=Novosphingobium terrae TaxID=2726189 RepID=UPI0019811985|nr:VOC family protein [Novosphingobium terrae]